MATETDLQVYEQQLDQDWRWALSEGSRFFEEKSAVQEATGGSVELAYVDQGYTGDAPFDAAAGRGIILEAAEIEAA